MSDYSRYYLKGVAGDYASAPQHYNDPRQTMPQTPPSSNSTPYTSPRLFSPHIYDPRVLFQPWRSSSNITLRSMQEEVMINNHIQELTMPPVTGTGTEVGTGTDERLSELISEPPPLQDTTAAANSASLFAPSLGSPPQTASSQPTWLPPSSVPEEHWWSCCSWPSSWSCWPRGCFDCSSWSCPSFTDGRGVDRQETTAVRVIAV